MKTTFYFSSRYQDNVLDITFGNLLRLSYVTTAQTFIVAELCIYTYLFNKLRRADQQFVKSKVITEQIRLERKEKNVIRLSGQASCFVIEMLGSISNQIIAYNIPSHASHLIPIIWIIASTLVSVCLFISSHEIKRYVKSKWYT